MKIESPIILSIGLAMTLGVALLCAIGARRLRWRAKSCFVLAAALLALAAGGASVRWDKPLRIVVMIDRSASTRTAGFRDESALQRRLGALLPGQTYQRVEFGRDEDARTRFEPPAADAIVLFSDGQFPLPPNAPPTYCVIDAALDRAEDAAVVDLHARGDRIVATFRNSGASRAAQLLDQHFMITADSNLVTADASENATSATARLEKQDAWPENDALTIPLIARASQRWWIGPSPPPGKWRTISPGQLSSYASDFIGVSLVALNAVSNRDLSATQQQRLIEYARDLGGGLLIISGEGQDALESISPLRDSPPSPRRKWILLIDRSGSMATPLDGRSRFAHAADVTADLLKQLPGDDLVTVGTFARDLRWLAQNQPAKDLSLKLDDEPGGPTNLDAALAAVAAQLDGSLPTELLIISDADATLSNIDELADTLRSKRARVELLATSQNAEAPAAKLAQRTGGSVIMQADPRRWLDAEDALLKSARGDDFFQSAATINFDAALRLPDEITSSWRREWIAAGASELAHTMLDNQTFPMAAEQRVGLGVVAATAFRPSDAAVEALAHRAQRRPVDPRFKATLLGTRPYLICLETTGDTSSAQVRIDRDAPHEMSRVSPDRFELSIDQSTASGVARVMIGDQLIDALPLPGRYPEEFDAIGNNRERLRMLADSTGGALIEPTQTTAINFARANRLRSIVSPLCAFAAALIAVGLLFQRFKRGEA